MSKANFIIAVVFMLLSTGCYSQKITAKELIGTWFKPESSEDTSIYVFTNNSALIIHSPKSGSYNSKYRLVSDSVKGNSILYVYSTSTIGEGNYENIYSVKRVSNTTLLINSLNTYDPIAIKVSDINKGNFYLIKRT